MKDIRIVIRKSELQNEYRKLTQQTQSMQNTIVYKNIKIKPNSKIQSIRKNLKNFWLEAMKVTLNDNWLLVDDRRIFH